MNPVISKVLSDRYFYASGSIRYGTLFYFMMLVMFKETMKNYDKEYFLNRFKEAGLKTLSAHSHLSNEL